MAAEKGRLFTISIGDSDQSPVSYTQVAGMRTKSMAFNGGPVDITNSDSIDAWREQLPGAGIKTLEITGEGVFKDSAADALVHTMAFDQIARMAKIEFPNFKRYVGLFVISSLSYAGNFDGVMTYNITLSSAGPISSVAI